MEARVLAVLFLIIGLLAGSLIGSQGFPRTITHTVTSTFTLTSTATLTETETATETVTTTVTTTATERHYFTETTTATLTETLTEYRYYTETLTETVPAWVYTGTVYELTEKFTIDPNHYIYDVVWVEEGYKLRVSASADSPVHVLVMSLPDYASWLYGEEITPIAEKKASTVLLEVAVPTSKYYIIVFYNDNTEETLTIYSYKIEILAS